MLQPTSTHRFCNICKPLSVEGSSPVKELNEIFLQVQHGRNPLIGNKRWSYSSRKMSTTRNMPWVRFLPLLYIQPQDTGFCMLCSSQNGARLLFPSASYNSVSVERRPMVGGMCPASRFLHMLLKGKHEIGSTPCCASPPDGPTTGARPFNSDSQFSLLSFLLCTTPR